MSHVLNLGYVRIISLEVQKEPKLSDQMDDMKDLLEDLLEPTDSEENNCEQLEELMEQAHIADEMMPTKWRMDCDCSSHRIQKRLTEANIEISCLISNIFNNLSQLELFIARQQRDDKYQPQQDPILSA